MKHFAYLALIGVAWAVKIAQEPTSLVVMNAMERMTQQIESKTEDDLQKLVDDAVKNAALKDTKTGKESLVKAGELKAVEKALAEKIYSRIIDTGLYRPTLGSSYYRPSYYYPSTYNRYAHYLPYGLDDSMTRVLGFHDYINRYETENRVIGHVTDPALTEILGVMVDLVNKNKAGEAKKEEAKPAAAAVKSLTQTNDNNQKLIIASSKVEMQEQLKGISDEAITRLVNQALENAKNKPAEDKDAAQKDGQLRAVEASLADKIYNRIISEGYYRPTYTSSYYRPYYPTYRSSYLSSDLDYEVRRVLGYHQYVNKYEVVNKVIGHTHDPKMEEIIGVLYDLINKKGAEGGANATANATKPAAKTLIQTEEGGIPVFVDPMVQKNNMAYADLGQRDYVIDGINGIDLVQTDSDMKNPVDNPPYNNWSVNQPSVPHDVGLYGKEDLGLRGITIDGIDGFSLVQTEDQEDDSLVMNVAGKMTRFYPDASLFVQTKNPVDNPPFNNWSVNQPSAPHDVGLKGREDLLVRDVTIDGVNGYGFVQTQTDLKNPVDNPPFNNWSVNQPSAPHDVGLKGREDLLVRDVTIDGVNGYGFAQTNADLKNPVDNPPFNNWSVNQPSVPHDVGMAGKENLGLDLVVRGHHLKVAQITNPVDNPPFNNWSVNQPSVPHDVGMKGKEDLGMDMVVNGHKIHIAQQEAAKQTQAKTTTPDPNGDLGLNLKIDGQVISVAQESQPQPIPNAKESTDSNGDLGLKMTIGGIAINVAQQPTRNIPPTLTDPLLPAQKSNDPDGDLGLKIRMDGMTLNVAQKESKGPFQQGMKGDEDLGLDMSVSGSKVHVAQNKQ